MPAFITVIVILILVVVLSYVSTAVAQTTVALHVTSAEIDIWEQRAAYGPYKEGWAAIKSRADAFVSNPDPRWAGKTTSGCYNYAVDGTPGRTRDVGLRDAGLAYLITGNTNYRNAARDALLAQVAKSGTNFSNSTRWCVPQSGNDQEVANWVRRLVYGFSYIRKTLSSTDRTTIDNWFIGAGRFIEAVVHRNIAVKFPNRLNDSYSTCASGYSCPGPGEGPLYYGGPMAYTFSQSWANKPAALTAAFTAIGTVVNDATLKARGKRFVEEWLRFAAWPNGAVYDQHRWDTSPANPQLGYSYAGTAIGSVISIADHLARSGDSSLYNFSTSGGMFGTQGGPKSLLKVIQHFAALTNGTVTEYASISSTTDPAKRIDPFGPTHNNIGYINLAPANIYYKNTSVKTAYSTAIPGSYMTGGYDPLGGDWGSYPHILFMFGQRENTASPYPTSTSGDSYLSAPNGLVVSAE